MFKATGQRRPVSALPYSAMRSRGLASHKQQQQEYLDAKLAATRTQATQGGPQQERGGQTWDDDSRGGQGGLAEQGCARPTSRPRPMSAGPPGYGGGLPGAVPHDVHTQPISR